MFCDITDRRTLGIFMAALCNRAGHIYFHPVVSSFFSSPNISGRRLDVYHTSTHGVAFIMQVWNVLRAARWKYSMQKIAKKSPSGHHPTTLSGYIINEGMHRQSEKNLLSSNISSTCPHNMVNFGPLATEICWRVWGSPTNFNGFCVLAALLHGIPVLGVSQTLWRWTEGATYIWQGGHHVGHWPTL